MILSEAEAKAKVCPFMTERSIPDGGRRTYCLGSVCMAWRWEKRKSPEELQTASAWNPNAASEEPKGYCGA